MALANRKQWQEAISVWQSYYESERNNVSKAKVANNIALVYEMLDDIDSAYNWATIAFDLFHEATANGSLDRRRSAFYKKELERRKDSSNKLNMQTGQKLF